MSASGVTVEEENGICILSLQSAHPENRLDFDLLDDFKSALLKCQDNPPRALIVTGGGADFSAGFDLNPDGGFADRIEAGVEHGEALACMEFAKSLRGYADRLARLSCLTIAAIEGVCHGAGLEIALACDLRVGSESSTYRFDHVRYGFIPCMGGLARLVPLVGRSRAIEWVILAPKVSAEDAESSGLIDARVPHGRAVGHARMMSQGVLKGEPKAIHQALLALREFGAMSDDAALKFESECAGRAFRAGGVLPGMKRYARHQAKKSASET